MTRDLRNILPWPRRTPPARVSVIVPLYNHARYIAAAIASILSQGRLVQEIIVIDDGSTDDSASVMEHLARQDGRIAFRRQANQGAHATINAGLQSSTGEFVTILNSDDAYLPGRLAALVAALDADREAAVAASALAFMDDAGQPVDNPWYSRALAEWRASGAMAIALINGNFLMTTSNLLFRRSLLADMGRFAPLRYTHDLDFALRLLARGKRIRLLDAALLRYRIHQGNTISEDHAKVRSEWALCAAAYFSQVLDGQRLDGAAAGGIDWAAAAALEDVLRRHELARAAHLCMAYLRRTDLAPLDRNPLFADADFLKRLAGWV